MADKSSIFKVRIDIANIDQHRYEQVGFTVSLGSRETIDHLVMRLIAYAMVPEEKIAFGHGVCFGADPDVMVKDYDDHYIYWIDIGYPEMTRVKKASNQADNVIIFSLEGSEWLDEHHHELAGHENVHLILLQPEFIEQLGNALNRHVNWSLVVDGNKISISDNEQYVESSIVHTHAHQSREAVHI